MKHSQQSNRTSSKSLATQSFEIVNAYIVNTTELLCQLTMLGKLKAG